jgi:F420H(2)-dependent quinone reductase
MAPPPVPPAGSLRLRVLNVLTRLNVIAYRASRGRLGGTMQQAPVCILHTVGRKSGKRRETPLLYLADGDDVVLIASAGGRETSPAWYHNLRAMDVAEVEILGRRTRMTPRVATVEERAELWPRVTAIYPDYDAYQARTEREIPVIVLSPAAEPAHVFNAR